MNIGNGSKEREHEHQGCPQVVPVDIGWLQTNEEVDKGWSGHADDVKMMTCKIVSMDKSQSMKMTYMIGNTAHTICRLWQVRMQKKLQLQRGHRAQLYHSDIQLLLNLICRSLRTHPKVVS